MATIRELLTEHNSLCSVSEDHAALQSWKGKKADLLLRVAELRRMVASVDSDKRITIQLIAEEALLEIAGEDDNGNRLGHSYEEVLARVRVFFPEAQTTPRSLAWYASKMRSAGMRVPFRPRARRQS